MEIYDTFINNKSNIQTDYNREKDKSICNVKTVQNDEVIILLPCHKNLKAYIVGNEVETSRADLMYISISLGADYHEIVLKYNLVEFRLGMKISFVSIMIIIFVFRKIENKCRSLHV